MQITGKEGEELIVSGAWLIRGQSIQPLVDANDDANWWVKANAFHFFTSSSIARFRSRDVVPPIMHITVHSPLMLFLIERIYVWRALACLRYDWVKVETPVSDADKALVTEMWCSETTVEGKPVLDGKVFK